VEVLIGYECKHKLTNHKSRIIKQTYYTIYTVTMAIVEVWFNRDMFTVYRARDWLKMNRLYECSCRIQGEYLIYKMRHTASRNHDRCIEFDNGIYIITD
jgi:hypothetical protein